MPTITLPFTKEKKIDATSLYQMLPKVLQDVTGDNPHLLSYLQTVPIDEVGIPQYHPKLNRKLDELKQPNIIYPTRALGNFVHIYFDPTDERHTYISIEPATDTNMDWLLRQIETRLLDFTDDLLNMNTDEEKKQSFLTGIDKVCIADGNAETKGNGLVSRVQFGRNGNNKIKCTPQELRAAKYLIVRDKVGVGILDPILHDPYVEDISCSGLGHVFIEHKIFHSLKNSVTFEDMDDLDEFVLRLAERVKKPVSLGKPIADATLPDGSRINIVYGRDLTKRGSNFTIRQFSDTPMSVLELVEMGTLDYKMAAYLSMTIEDGMSVFISGETASGKTTTLNALTTFIPPNHKVVSIEDTPELKVPHKHWLQEVVQTTKQESENEVTMFDLLKASLRQRPNEIIVGEIRGPEGAIAFQAMQTGHPVMSTFHAASVQKLIQRLTGTPINVPKTYIDNLNVIVIQSAVKLPNGKLGRRVLSLNEIVGYDGVNESFAFLEIFRWDPVTDSFEFTGYMNSFLLEQKIALRRGIPTHQLKRIYQELDRRAKVLEKLHKERGITNFYELLTVLATAQQQGLF